MLLATEWPHKLLLTIPFPDFGVPATIEAETQMGEFLKRLCPVTFQPGLSNTWKACKVIHQRGGCGLITYRHGNILQWKTKAPNHVGWGSES